MIDREVIEQCRNGNSESFRTLIAISSPFAFSVAFKMLGDEDLAKDVVQESMISIWTKLKKIRSAGSYKTWLYRIVVNRCYDQLRKSKRNPEVRTDDKAWAIISQRLSEDNSSDLDNMGIALVINQLTENLSSRQKSVFILSDLEEMTPEEISEITGMSRRNIKANLYYARRNIGNMLKKYV